MTSAGSFINNSVQERETPTRETRLNLNTGNSVFSSLPFALALKPCALAMIEIQIALIIRLSRHPKRRQQQISHSYLFRFKGADTKNVKLADASLLVHDTLRDFVYSTGVDNGLAALGYQSEDIPALVKGTLPQHRVTKLATAGVPGEEEPAKLFEDSMTLY